MKKCKTLHGRVARGCGDAAKWEMSEIRKETRLNLVEGTLNVRLEEAHTLKPDCQLSRKDRKDGRDEDLYFQYCWLLLDARKVPAVIARTSNNFHGDMVLEIMAEEVLRAQYSLEDGAMIEIRVLVEDSETS